MLYKLEVENFFSIRDLQILDLTIDAKVPDPDGRFAPIFPGSAARAPKVVVIYGANASGKTTMLRALSFLIAMARDSVDMRSPFQGYERFNDVESASRPARFAIELGGTMDLTPEVQQREQRGESVDHGLLRYELELEVVDGIALRITKEALRQKPYAKGKWQRVFERDEHCRVKDSKSFSLSGYQHLVKTLAQHHTVLSSFSKFQHPVAQIIVESSRRAIFQVEPVPTYDDKEIVDYLKKQPNVLAGLNEELNRIDVGVESVGFQQTPDGPKLYFKHIGLEQQMPWWLESHGTRAFIKMYPFLIAGLASGGLVAIDEMDTAIHPLILPELVGWFHDKQGRNKYDAQLWLTCQSASLLDDLEKEEIAICEKDLQGRTTFHSLMDVKVRRDENHYRKYLSGSYGGVPHLG